MSTINALLGKYKVNKDNHDRIIEITQAANGAIVAKFHDTIWGQAHTFDMTGVYTVQNEGAGNIYLSMVGAGTKSNSGNPSTIHSAVSVTGYTDIGPTANKVHKIVATVAWSEDYKNGAVDSSAWINLGFNRI